MAYRHLGQETGTVPVKCKINASNAAYIEQHGLIFNAVVNEGLYRLIRDIQTDVYKPTWQMSQQTRASRWHGDYLVIKAARIRRDLIEYLKLNSYNVNGTINVAVTRMVTQWQGNEKKKGFEFPHYLRKDRGRETPTMQHRNFVGTKSAAGDGRDAEPEPVAITPESKDIQFRAVRYLSDPCPHADWLADMTRDCCGHCSYYVGDEGVMFVGKCSRNG